MKKRSKLVFGVGLNDSDYQTHIYENSELGRKLVWICPFYSVWIGMLGRCYKEATLLRNPAYRGCATVEEWHRFSNFKAWMEAQDWEGKQLDKDLLFIGNKSYGPDTCVFVPAWVNTAILIRQRDRGTYPLGVHYIKDKRSKVEYPRPYFCQIRTGEGKREYLGVYSSAMEAHAVWQAAKIDQLKIVIDRYSKEDNYSEKVVKSIQKRIFNIQNDLQECRETVFL